jgi:hypothetical protein
MRPDATRDAYGRLHEANAQLRADRDAALKRAESYRSKLDEVMKLLAKAVDTEAELVVCRDRAAELEREVELQRSIVNGYASSCSIEYRDRLEDEIRELRATLERVLDDPNPFKLDQARALLDRFCPPQEGS